MRTSTLLSLVLLLGACSAVTTEQGRIEAHFCPSEDCGSILLAEVRNASSVACAFYDLNFPALQQTLIEKNASVLVYDKNFNGFGTPVANDRGLMHDKFCVLDARIVITGSLNPTTGMQKNDNNIVIVDGELLAQNYLAEFSELARGTSAPVPHPRIEHTLPDGRTLLIENYFCPEDACAEHVRTALAQARRSITFLTYSFTDDQLGDTLVERAARGVEIRGVFEKSQESQYSEYAGLKAAGLDVRLDGNPAIMHHKVFIVDAGTPEAVVVTGSYNPTKNGDTRNDENMLIVHDAPLAEEYVHEFERVWAAAH